MSILMKFRQVVQHHQPSTNRQTTQSMVKILEAISPIIQSIPSSSFSPVTALQPRICQWWVLMSSSSKRSRIPSAFSAPGKSCLFANTSNVAPPNRLIIKEIKFLYTFLLKLVQASHFCLQVPATWDHLIALKEKIL